MPALASHYHTHLYCCERKVTMEAGVTWKEVTVMVIMTVIVIVTW